MKHKFSIFCVPDLKYRLVYCPKCIKTSIYVARQVICSICETAILYQCGKCMKIYKKNSYLRQHLLRYCNNEESKIFCGLCQYKTCSKVDFTTHIRAKHLLSDVNSNKCKNCGKCFLSNVGLQSHSIICSLPKDSTRLSEIEIFCCSHCNYRAFNEPDVSYHIQATHLAQDPSLNECTKCGKSFSCVQALRKHSEICNISFFTKDSKLSSELRTFSCNDCKYKTKRKSHLSDHIQAKHLQQNPNLNKCQKCKKSFSCFSYLRKHAKVCTTNYSCNLPTSNSFSGGHFEYKTPMESNFSTSLQVKHLSPDLNLSKCHYCRLNFSHRSSLIEHFKTCVQTKNFMHLLRSLPEQNQGSDHRVNFQREPKELWNNYKSMLLLVLPSFKSFNNS